LNATTAGGPLLAGKTYRLRLYALVGGTSSTWGQDLNVVPTANP